MMTHNIVDIPEPVRAQEQLRTEFAPAARISVLAELATTIAHEVSQPLAAMRTNIETSLRYLKSAGLIPT